ncbi:hypothetical protein BC834DRAFT_845307 [Gloeopeniophorella convolvens]|nr:hypothetical protein BC834DRAFT_845307 [Gloeopeniophorella convolvens]
MPGRERRRNPIPADPGSNSRLQLLCSHGGLENDCTVNCSPWQLTLVSLSPTVKIRHFTPPETFSSMRTTPWGLAKAATAKPGQSHWKESLQLREKALKDAIFCEESSPAVVCDETPRIFEENIKVVPDTLLPAFKERRNATSPTAKLPAEVLVLIFETWAVSACSGVEILRSGWCARCAHRDPPQLQCIVLKNLLVIDWKPLSGPANHLARLEVINTPAFGDPGTVMPNRIGDALKLLECIPALEILSLVNCFPSDQPDSTVGPASAPVAALPRLRRLNLETSMRNGLHSFNHVDFPGETRIRSWLYGGVIDEPTIISLVQRAFRYFHPGTTTTTPSVPPSGSLAFLEDPTGGMQVLSHSEPHIPLVSPTQYWEEMHAEMDVSLTFATDVHALDSDNVLRAAADALPESFALSLALSCENTDVWRALAQRFPRAREITAFGQFTAIALGGALMPMAWSVKAVPFPALAHLRLSSPRQVGELHGMMLAFRARERLNQRLGRLSVGAQFCEEDTFMYSMQEVADDVGEFEEGVADWMTLGTLTGSSIGKKAACGQRARWKTLSLTNRTVSNMYNGARCGKWNVEELRGSSSEVVCKA